MWFRCILSVPSFISTIIAMTTTNPTVIITIKVFLLFLAALATMLSENVVDGVCLCLLHGANGEVFVESYSVTW